MVAAPEFFTPEQETPDGWRLPLTGNLISYLYVRRLDLAFEVWLGGDSDVTVGLERPFRFGLDDNQHVYDPRTTRKSELGPLLELGTLEVAEFVVRKVGELNISFSDGSRLIAVAAVEGPAWRLEWPFDEIVGVASRQGGGLDWPNTAAVSETSRFSEAPVAVGTVEPVARGDVLELPIRGRVAESPVSGSSIELAIRMPDGGDFCIHFGGDIQIADPVATWRGRGDADDRSSLSRVLDLIGMTVVAAHVDEGQQLRLTFAGGSQLVAAVGAWEAHWPKSTASLEEHWVPEEGPSIP